MPGEVSASAAPSVERFFEYQLSALPGQISSGRRLRPFAFSSLRVRCRAHAALREEVLSGEVGDVLRVAHDALEVAGMFTSADHVRCRAHAALREEVGHVLSWG